ncbi:AraC family transcriptional regulator [Opitutaceae bacterium TAV5]|nr:AraC family transcriptional regulator [Opitutaceae bacterium TAV5]
MSTPTFRFPDIRPTLRELGVDAVRVLRAAGLPLAVGGESGVQLTTEQMFAFWRALETVSDDPLTGIELARRVPLEQHHPACIAAQHARTFRDALQRFARYKYLCCAEELGLAEGNGECRVGFSWLQTTEPVPPRLIDAAFAGTVELGRRGTRRPLNPLRVELARPPTAVERFEAYFGCRVHFRARRSVIVFRLSDLDLPFVTYNAELLEMLSPSLDRELARRKATSTLAGQAKWVMQRLVGARLPQIGEVAKELAVSPRTLQRRIAEEGSNFRQLLADARRELAHRYLREPAMTLTETACLLGFEDPNSFYRAFREWEGVTPGEWRRRQTVAGAA